MNTCEKHGANTDEFLVLFFPVVKHGGACAELRGTFCYAVRQHAMLRTVDDDVLLVERGVLRVSVRQWRFAVVQLVDMRRNLQSKQHRQAFAHAHVVAVHACEYGVPRR